MGQSGSGRFQGLISYRLAFNLITRARNYVYINTPYLDVGNELLDALTIAAKSGVDVRMTVPHIPDKKMVFLLTKAYYPVLIRAGVKIYEYTPGFIHSKTFVCDDVVGIVGTINLDFRSLYLHWEETLKAPTSTMTAAIAFMRLETGV